MNAALFGCIRSSLDKPVAVNTVMALKLEGSMAHCTITVGSHVRLERRLCHLEAGVGNVMLSLPAGLELRVEGCEEPCALRTQHGRPIEVALAAPGAAPFTVIFDVHAHDLQAMASADVRRLGSVRVVVGEGARAVSLEAAKHRLAQIQAVERELAGCDAAAPGLALFGGAQHFELARSAMPPSAAAQGLILTRLEAAVEALGTVRLDGECAPLARVAVRRFAPADADVFIESVRGLLAARTDITSDIKQRRGNRAHTRVVYHALQSVDGCLRSHVAAACGSAGEDFALERRARLFELHQLSGTNAHNAVPAPESVLTDTLALLAGLPTPAAAAGSETFSSALARSLHAQMLLGALPANAFELATHPNFSYFRPHAPRAREECGTKEFLLQKIETDCRHGIIPLLLGTHIRDVLAAGAEDPRVQGLLSLFDPDIQPLVCASLTGKDSAGAYTYLDTTAQRSGYQAPATRSLMLALLTSPKRSACACA